MTYVLYVQTYWGCCNVTCMLNYNEVSLCIFPAEWFDILRIYLTIHSLLFHQYIHVGIWIVKLSKLWNLKSYWHPRSFVGSRQGASSKLYSGWWLRFYEPQEVMYIYTTLELKSILILWGLHIWDAKGIFKYISLKANMRVFEVFVDVCLSHIFQRTVCLNMILALDVCQTSAKSLYI